MPTVDRQGQRAAHAGVVEWLLLVVGLEEAAAVPVARLQRHLVAESADQLVAHGRRKAAKLYICTSAAQRGDANRLLVGVARVEPAEIGQPPWVIVGVAHPL